MLAWPCSGKRDPFRGPRVGSCLTLRNELSEETHPLTKTDFTGEAPVGEGSPGGVLCPVARSLGLRWWDEFPGRFWPIILTQSPSWWCTHSSEEGSGRLVRHAVSPLDLSWILLLFWLVSSMFLTRDSCHKMTHANGYYGAWWFQAVFPLRVPTSESPHGWWLPLPGTPFPLFICCLTSFCFQMSHLRGPLLNLFYFNVSWNSLY